MTSPSSTYLPVKLRVVSVPNAGEEQTFRRRGGRGGGPVIVNEKCQSCISRCMDKQSPASVQQCAWMWESPYGRTFLASRLLLEERPARHLSRPHAPPWIPKPAPISAKIDSPRARSRRLVPKSSFLSLFSRRRVARLFPCFQGNISSHYSTNPDLFYLPYPHNGGRFPYSQ